MKSTPCINSQKQYKNMVKSTKITNFILPELLVIEMSNIITPTIARPPDGNPINVSVYSSVNHIVITFHYKLKTILNG